MAEGGPIVAVVEGAEKKVSVKEYLDIQLKQLQKTKCARDDALVAENQFLRQFAREHGIVVPPPVCSRRIIEPAPHYLATGHHLYGLGPDGNESSGGRHCQGDSGMLFLPILGY
jgi:hypothetical protein